MANKLSESEIGNKKTIKNVDIAKSTAVMVGALLVCYLPLIVKWHICNSESFIFSLLSQVLVAANSFMNPFIYAAKVKAFRNILRGYITKFNKTYEPETEVIETA